MLNPKPTLLLACIIPLLAFAIAGCDRSGHPGLGKVQGTVSYQGKPISAGSLVFEVAGARQAQGTIVDGKITAVTTFSPGDGVPVGAARIAVFALATTVTPADKSAVPPGKARTASLPDASTADKPLIPSKYNNPATSGLTCDIVPGDNKIALDLRD